MLLSAALTLQMLPAQALAEELESDAGGEGATAVVDESATEEESSGTAEAGQEADDVVSDQIDAVPNEEVTQESKDDETVDEADLEAQAEYKVTGPTRVPVGAKATYTVSSGGSIEIASGEDLVSLSDEDAAPAGGDASLSGQTLTGEAEGEVILNVLDDSGEKLYEFAVDLYSLYGYYTIRSAINSSYVLDVANGSLVDRGNIQLYRDNGTKSQIWEIRGPMYDTGSFIIHSAPTYKCIDVAAGSKANKANVRQWRSNNSNAQNWDITVDSKNRLTFVNRGSGKALDVSGGVAANKQNIQQYQRNNTLAQKWTITETTYYESRPIFEGIYRIAVNGSSGHVLDVAGGSKSNGANVRLWRSNESNAQRWKITRVDYECYRITNVGSGKVLDVAGGSKKSGANVRQWAWNGSNAQLWRAVWVYNGIDIRTGQTYPDTLSFENVGSGLRLDISGGKITKGTNIQQYRFNGSAAQAFKLYEY